MNQQTLNYTRIASAIDFIKSNFKSQPSLEQIAEAVNLSPFHFQKLFQDWAGVSPKKFLQYISIEYAKRLLKHEQATLFDAAMDTGLSGTGRLHDLFVSIEAMTPAEFRNGAENININYSFAESPFGDLIVASTGRGVCYLAFIKDEAEGLQELKSRFPGANLMQKTDQFQLNALKIFQTNWQELPKIKLHLKGTEFQLKVWETLLQIPMGKIITYGNIAESLASPKASRAVGTAIGSNPIAFLIPCHRVIQSSGKLGGYMWGETRKSAIIGWESALLNPEPVG